MDAVNAQNILAWVLQVTSIASAGALLGAIVRIKDARLRLAYCYAVMLAALFLPAFQPLHSELMLTTAPLQPGGQAPAPSELSATAIILAVLVCGSLVRLAWLAAGFAELRGLRQRSCRLYPVSEALQQARRRVAADAEFRTSESMTTPAALGHLQPLILLPLSFLEMPERAQHAIAVHELLHVKRRDWLRTVLEQCLTVVFWFNPGVWWLVAESRLCREEIVDSEVVALTGERLQYVDALLAFTRIKPSLVPLPAAPFFSRRHFAERMQAILRPARHSFSRVVLSGSTMIVAVLCCALTSFVLFPLQGHTEVLSVRLPSPPLMSFTPMSSVQVAAQRIPVQMAPIPDMETASETRHNVVFTLSRLTTIPVPFEIARFRAIRPGTVMSPAEVQRLLTTMPAGQIVEITQDSDNRVMRIVIGRSAIRRASDETDRFGIDASVDAIDSHTTAPAEPADSID